MKVPRVCVDCSSPFEGERWQKFCWGCWKGRKDDDAYTRGYVDGLAAGIRHVQEQHADPFRELAA